MELLSAGPSDPLRIDQLATRLGIHRSHLARRFRGRYGCGMREFALRHQANIPNTLGYDLSAALTYRPLFSQNIVLRLSGAVLLPGDGLKALFNTPGGIGLFGNGGALYSVLANVILTSHRNPASKLKGAARLVQQGYTVTLGATIDQLVIDGACTPWSSR